jgi:hypothetical protein
MAAHRVVSIVFFGLLFNLLLLSGCANYLQPELGAIAKQGARVELVKNGVQDTSWITKDLDLTYSYSESGNTFNLFGRLTFDRSLTDSFPLIRRFIIKMSFLDGEGRVLETINITPLFGHMFVAPNYLTIKSSSIRPMGARSIAFSYFGVFVMNDNEMPDERVIFCFPFD